MFRKAQRRSPRIIVTLLRKRRESYCHNESKSVVLLVISGYDGGCYSIYRTEVMDRSVLELIPGTWRD
jgi:hypothetical protein